MTSDFAAWVSERAPTPPPLLTSRIAALYDGAPPDDRAAVSAEQCVDAAARAVGALLTDGATSRATALDLLAADALATYAFELASERPQELAALADAAMRRFAALAGPDAAR
ncbi:hypothetical protein [Roseisolibacter agri]|uniref:Uncharacterized protein n=1 Tax=Roseisolibacter agri TaxID=2014610 RepID=A0AA37VCB6_9BACT|nr:hypothetical protein [Roseisolibacter agri]GLC27508.1 hypothetical protein rosag_40210 [Roseisolibacter agri]